MARSTVNTDGTRLRSSSVKTRPGSATVSARRRFVVCVERDLVERPAALRAMIGSSDLAALVQRLDPHGAADAPRSRPAGR